MSLDESLKVLVYKYGFYLCLVSLLH